CECNREIVKGRMAKRASEAVQISDATWDVFEKVEQSWTTFESASGLYAVTDQEVFAVNTEKHLDLAITRVHGFLRKLGLE
ncbi:hypothetical protein DYB25_005298, partial [Aphanomyces astaci]